MDRNSSGGRYVKTIMRVPAISMVCWPLPGAIGAAVTAGATRAEDSTTTTAPMRLPLII
jgi:hypothetical protein